MFLTGRRRSPYTQAIEAGDRLALGAALARNVAPEHPRWEGATELARYVFAADHALSHSARRRHYRRPPGFLPCRPKRSTQP